MNRTRAVRTDGRTWVRAVRSVLCAGLLAGGVLAQAKEDSKDEVFELVDPYTGGDRAGLDRAGYVGLGPFPLWEGVRTEQLEEAIGRRVLWVETQHFKLGSTLETFDSRKADRKEERRVKEELERLRPHFVRFRPAPGKLDPWLRLHLYAQRVEDEYAAFARLLGLKPEDFPQAGATVPPSAPQGVGPYFGQAQKFVVLLLEKDSHFGRIVSRWGTPTKGQSLRQYMPSGGMLLVTSAETIAGWGYPQEAAFHCTLAEDLTLNFVDGLLNRGFQCPWWWKLGLAHIAARRIDEKLVIYANRAARSGEHDTWKWEPRVLALVTNDYAPKWAEMSALEGFEKFTGATHMVAWSRVSWLLQDKTFDARAFAFALARTFPDLTGSALVEARSAHERETLKRLTGKSLEELDEGWRLWVTRTYKP